MKKQIQSIFLLVILIVFNHTAFGVSAYPYPVEITQPDGTKITIIQRGDEFVKWAQTVDGYSILRNSKGIYEYAKLDSRNDMIPSGIPVRDALNRSAGEIQFLLNTSKNLSYSTSQLGMMKSISDMQKSSNQKSFPTTGSRKLVCILIGFTDKAFTKTKADFDNLFNQVGYTDDGASGSVYDFYKENSYGQLNLNVTVAGPFTAAHNMAYYGANDSNGKDINPGALITEAVTLADPTVDYSNFDNDNDGTVDGVYVIYAGYGEEYSGTSSDAIWAHASSIQPLTLDGKTVSRYSCSCELRGNSGTGITRIGVICHEFGHVLGAHDYYDTDKSTNTLYFGTGCWDLMGGGNWNNYGATPAHHNAYTKVYDYNWATATTLTSTASIWMTNAEENTNSFYRINTTTAGEFFLIENRQKLKFDTYIPGHGMIIYRVDKNFIDVSGNWGIINASSHQRMYPVCANATANPPTDYGVINSSGLPFPGTSNITSFTDATTPSAQSWVGSPTNKPITYITENISTKSVSFNFGTNSAIPTTTTVAASNTSNNATTLNAVVSSNYASTTVTFEYGTTTSYGNTVNGNPNSINNDAPVTITANLTGLTANTTYNYRVKAVNAIGTAYGNNVTFTTSSNPIVLTLPVIENFDTPNFPSGWSTQNIGTGISERWSMSNSSNAGGSAYELKCTYVYVSPGTTRIITPAINTTGVSSIAMSFKHWFDDFASGATLKVQSSVDKINWTDEAWSLASKSAVPVGPETINTTISNNLNAPTTYIAFVIDGNLYQFSNWYVDNLSLKAANANTIPTLSTTAASTITSSAATSGGNVTDEGGTPVTAKGVCWSTSVNPTIALNTKTIIGSGLGAFTSNITLLAAGTIYHVRAWATNAVGTGYGPDITFTTSIVPAPVAIGASNILQAGFSANWNSEATATGYRLDVSTNSGFSTFVSGYNDKDVGNVLTYNITGQSATTVYYYRLRAYNAGGTGGNSNTIVVTTLSVPPPAPTGLTVTCCSNVATLKWKKSTGANVQKYRIYGGLTSNPTVVIDSTTNTISDTVKLISGLTIGQTYYYRMTSVNLDGSQSVFSNQVSQKALKVIVPRIAEKWGDVLICSNIGDSISGYQWLKNNVVIPNAVSQYYATTKQPGIYKVIITDKNGCISPSNPITITGTKSLSIYPNPTAASFSIKVNDKPTGKAHVTVINSGGINVIEFESEIQNNELPKEISVSNLIPGIYVVKVLMDNKDLYYSKVVVIK